MVQGFEAAPQIAAAIRTLDRSGRADVIIVARGGGSREDLWVFNAEVIARAAFACKTPLISAIGHEIDYTILDFVADQRAPTPSAAAELAVPDREEQWNILQNLQQNISENMQKRLKLCYNELEQYNLALERKPAHHIWKRDFDQLEQAGQTLQIQIQRRMQAANMQLEHAAALTASLSPYRGPCPRLCNDHHGQRTDPSGRPTGAGPRPSTFAALPAGQSAGWRPWRKLMKAPKSYEEGMERLNAILAKMQDEQTTLAEAVKLYAEAASLMEYCHTALEKTSLQIEEIDAKITQTIQEQREEN